ncbi:MAG: sigma 54-interacting transcriptional regulator, partial [Verrucomicrobiota bacterium]
SFEVDFPGKAFEPLRRQLERIAPSEHSLLLTGESGTGKSRLAYAVHQNSKRSKGEFVELSCASIPANLLESELFGYRKGAFSGAFKDKIGLLEKADGGTVFLDEIGEMSPELQPKLLLFLQNQRFYPVGSADPQEVDVRLIAATNQDLNEAIGEGRFRRDLYYRLNVFELELPALRARPGDIPVLALQFLTEALGPDTPPSFSDSALDVLLNYNWPGNIRELRNVMLRVATLVDSGDKVQPEHLPKHFEPSTSGQPETGYSLSGKTLEEIEKDALQIALDENEGHRRLAAEQLGVSLKTVYNLIKRYQI